MSSAENPTLRFELGLHGWSALCIIHEAGRIDCDITHVFNDPIESLILLIEDIRRGSFPAMAAFHDEPGMHVLKLSTDEGEAPRLSVLHSHKNYFSGLDVEGFHRIAQFDVNPTFIATQIEAELFRIEHLMSHKLYQKDRSPVPMHRIAELRRR